jgi:hypothetical protein
MEEGIAGTKENIGQLLHSDTNKVKEKTKQP